MFDRSAIFRLAAAFSLAFTAVTLVLGLFAYHVVRDELRSELDQHILSERAALLREVAVTGRSLAEVVDARERNGGKNFVFALADGAGHRLSGRTVSGKPALGWASVDFREHDGSLDGARAYVSAFANGDRLVVGSDPEPLEELDDRIVPLIAIVFGAMAITGGAGGFLISAAIRRRLETITRTAEAIIGGAIDRRVPLSGSGDEFDRLAATLNRMLDRIEGLLTNIRQVSSDVAHDLRTPLTRLRQRIETALASHDVEQLRTALADAGDRTDEVLDLFTAILSITEIEAGAGMRSSPFDLSDLVTDIIDSYRPAAEDMRQLLRHRVESGIMLDGRRELAAQLLVNLLDNALRHTPPCSTIDVELSQHDTFIDLVVADNGPGIPPEDRERVFERFVRLEHSRTSAGHGLGLRLVSAIAEAHRAKVILESNQPGVRMIVRFPKRAA